MSPVTRNRLALAARHIRRLQWTEGSAAPSLSTTAWVTKQKSRKEILKKTLPGKSPVTNKDPRYKVMKPFKLTLPDLRNVIKDPSRITALKKAQKKVQDTIRRRFEDVRKVDAASEAALAKKKTAATKEEVQSEKELQEQQDKEKTDKVETEEGKETEDKTEAEPPDKSNKKGRGSSKEI